MEAIQNVDKNRGTSRTHTQMREYTPDDTMILITTDMARHKLITIILFDTGII